MSEQEETPTIPVFHLTDEELKARRKELLEEAGMTLREILYKATTQQLEGAQWDLAEQVGAINFLLEIDNDD